MNRVLFKIFGAMAKDSYLEISSHFGIYSLEQSIALRGDKFVKKYSSSDNYFCRLIANISLSFFSFFFVVLYLLMYFLRILMLPLSW